MNKILICGGFLLPLIFLPLFLLLVFASPCPAAEPFSNHRTTFSISVGGNEIDYKIFSLFVLPKEKLNIAINTVNELHEFEVRADGGALKHIKGNNWVWVAPKGKGKKKVVITEKDSKEAIELTIVNMIPFAQKKGDFLNGYRIGSYPVTAVLKTIVYNKPKGFIELTPENEEMLVSPHFRLGQFKCKQASGYPKYIVLKEKLILKLEGLLEAVNKAGYLAQTFHVMSGYRTPFYNKQIGNVPYSRHVYGDAADFYIDQDPEDGYPDDLNQDGKIDYHDSQLLRDLVEKQVGESWYEGLIGGLARYKKNDAHGPFVHVDTRGRKARW